MSSGWTGYAANGDVWLYYEVHGPDPSADRPTPHALLIVQGGAGDARATPGLVEAVAPTRRVITYDRRGLARSSRGVTSVSMWTHARDAAAVIAAVEGDAPALVVGTSIGALIGLHLLAARPEQVQHLVAHEPPMTSVVYEPERERAHDEVAAIAAREGPAAGIARMLAVIGLDPSAMVFEEGASPPPRSPTALEDLRTYFAQDFPAVRDAVLGPDELSADQRARLTPAGGVSSRGGWEYRCAQALAIACGRELLELPGAHNGVTTHPRAVAAAVRDLL